MPNFIGGLPAQGTQITSSEIRDNFTALNARTGKIIPRATNPASTSITISRSTIYLKDKISVTLAAQSIKLGDLTTGVSKFNNIGFFKDIAIVIRLSFNEATSRYSAAAVFIEGPEKASSTSQPELVPINNTDLPVARLVVRHNGINLVDKGQIEPIRQEQIADFRNYLDVGAATYYSASVGDRQVAIDAYGVLETDAYGAAIVDGETIGNFTGELNGINVIQQAIDSIATTGGTVFIKRGYYPINETIVVPDNVQLLGEGKSTIIEQLDEFTDPLFSVTGDNVAFINLCLQGPLPGASVVTEPLIKFFGSEHCTIRGCYIDDGIVGVEFDTNSDRNICSGNFFNGDSVGVRISGDKNIVTQNQFENKLISDIDNLGTGNVTSPNILS